MTDSGWLVLGGLHHLNGSPPPTTSDQVILARLSVPVHELYPTNTVVLSWAELGQLELSVHSLTSGGSERCGSLGGAELFEGMLVSPKLADLVWSPPAVALPGPLVPLFYLSVRPTATGHELHVHSQIRFLAEDACFIRTTPEPLVVRDVAELTWFAEAVRRHAQNFLFLNNHQRYYQRCFPGQELEYKYTMTTPVDIWTLTVELFGVLKGGGLPGYVMEYRDEFQAWDYLNNLYQVTHPEAERGYVSFIPTTDGKNLVKRKWFAADSFNRRETHTYGVQPPDGYEAYLRDELAVSAVRLPPFRRVRYDVNIESARTGHVYGIFFDQVNLVDAPDLALYQCELEYLRSRTVIEVHEDDVLTEIAEIAAWLEKFLREHGISDERGVYSKLSFLLDCVAARPALVGAVS